MCYTQLEDIMHSYKMQYLQFYKNVKMNTILNTCNMSRDMIGTRVGNILCTSLIYHISFIPSPLLPHPIAPHIFSFVKASTPVDINSV